MDPAVAQTAAVRTRPPARPESQERRASPRLPLELLLEVHHPDEPGRVIEKGVTRDVSPGGLSFGSFNWRQLPAGARCRVVLLVPFECALFTNSRHLVTTATVVRWDDEGYRVRGFAVSSAPPPVRRDVALRFDEPLVFAASA